MNSKVLRRAERILVSIDIVLMLAMALSIFLVVSPFDWIFDLALWALCCLFLAVGLLSAAAVFVQGMRLSVGRGDTLLGRWHMRALLLYAICVVIVGVCSAAYDGIGSDIVVSVGIAICMTGYFYAGIMTLINSYRQIDGSNG